MCISSNFIMMVTKNINEKGDISSASRSAEGGADTQ
jgi:hypothetical protein